MSEAPSDAAVFEAAMRAAAASGWRAVSLATIAGALGLEPAALAARFPDKRALLDGLAGHVDATVDAAADAELRNPDLPVRDRLFEVLMLRLEALAPYRDGLRAVLAALPFDPATALGGLPALRRAMRHALEVAGAGHAGPCGELRAQGLAVAFLAALRTSLDDDAPDLAATQRALDRALGQAERLAVSLGLARAAEADGAAA